MYSKLLYLKTRRDGKKMTAEELFEEKKYLVIAAIKQQFGSI
ncbi:RNA polymerase subunit sigma, partial [Bacillus cereus]